jgi:hypothetical protein
MNINLLTTFLVSDKTQNIIWTKLIKKLKEENKSLDVKIDGINLSLNMQSLTPIGKDPQGGTVFGSGPRTCLNLELNLSIPDELLQQIEGNNVNI